MNIPSKEQLRWFNELHEHRRNATKYFLDDEFIGLFSEVIDKYPESAHFVYELLQNADDTEATFANIIINKNQMIFKHNGKKHFNVTPRGVTNHGDINAITGIGHTTKKGKENSIGKFGVGFKAIFQYTETPEIYDDIFKFKIEDYIVPTLIDYDHPDRNDGETLFLFPFKDPEKAFNDIVDRVKKLNSPILFLNNLTNITISIQAGNHDIETTYEYSKICTKLSTYKDGTILSKVILSSPNDRSTIFLFSKEVEIKHKIELSKHYIHVGFYYDDINKKLITNTKREVFCFFPTKENFETCYVCHAPFLLTSNRQNLKPGEETNKFLISQLASLAANAVLHLRDYGKVSKCYYIDENILDILPNYRYKFMYGTYIYEHTYEEIIDKTFNNILSDENIFLSRNNEYLKEEQAYTGQKYLIDLLTPKQLKMLRCEDDFVDFLKWEIIKKYNDSQDSNNPYDNLTFKDYQPDLFARDITAHFMSCQDIKWVSKMYTYLRTRAVELWKYTGSEEKKGKAYLPFRKAPIIKIQSGEWVQPYTSNFIPNVFLPIANNNSSGYNFIHEEYMNNDICVKFFKEMEITQPDELAYIREIIVKKYNKYNNVISNKEVLEDTNYVLNYYNSHSDKQEEIVYLFKFSYFFMNKAGRLTFPSFLYLEDNVLKVFFKENQDKFIDISFYQSTIEKFGEETFKKILIDFGVLNRLKLERSHFDDISRLRLDVKSILSTFAIRENIESWSISDYCIPYFAQLDKSKLISYEISKYIWNEILCNISPFDIYKYMYITYRKKRRKSTWIYSEKFSTSLLYELKNIKWLYNIKNERCSCDDIYIEDLAEGYIPNRTLYDFLELKKRYVSIIELGATQEQQQIFDFGSSLKSNFGHILSDEEMLNLLRKEALKKELEAQKKIDTSVVDGSYATSEVQSSEDTLTNLQNKWSQKENTNLPKPRHTKQADELPQNIATPISSTEKREPILYDSSFTGTRNITNEKDDTIVLNKLDNRNNIAQEAARKTEENRKIFELLRSTPKYTYLWYKLLMELMHEDNNNSSVRHLQIDFSSKAFKCDSKILHLSNPSHPVPQWILDAEKVTISSLADEPKKIEGIIVKADETSIDISVEFTPELNYIYNKAKKIRVVADNSANIIDSLETRFLQLAFDDDYDLNENLPKNISFIYGPPGTGKTTRLVKMVSDILKSSQNKVNILVLTPTNKAADVIAVKMVDDKECFNYLTRFGSTESLYLIEDAAVVCNRSTMDMNLLDKNVLVTTAARYAYDYVQPDDTFLCDYNWDYVIIDEASMVDIITCTYILHKSKSAKFIISGDPKQIQPVQQNDMPAYNIYDMVELNDFSDAVNNYTRYNVIPLKTQHRSIPDIGYLVSEYSYNGIVKADVNRAPQKPLSIDGMNIKNINFLGFEILDFDLIKGISTINGSAFHLYSAIFSYKFAEYIITQVSKNHPNKEYSIGIVSPYGAEANAIKQMLENRPINNDMCNVTCGTVHSFQGDECDIMFVVLNPPAHCSKGAHINNPNILNVAMSRAKDYIFFILPQGPHKGMLFKEDVNRILKNKDKGMFWCSDIEETMFGVRNYIVSNTHVTCHMPVNVYCENNSIFEVRMSDDALDIKINQ